MLFGDTNLALLKRMLDASALRHKAIAHNIANVNTPGYRRWEVRFQEELRAALDRGAGREALGVQPRLIQPRDPTTRLDGSNVDLEREYAALSRNAALFNTMAQIVAMRLAAYRAAIGDSDE